MTNEFKIPDAQTRAKNVAQMRAVNQQLDELIQQLDELIAMAEAEKEAGWSALYERVQARKQVSL